MVQKQCSKQFPKTKEKCPAHSAPNGWWNGFSTNTSKMETFHVLSFQVPNWEKKKKTILSSLPGSPTHHIYTLVLGLTQFLQKFFFHLSKLNTHRHFSYELLTAFLGNLLAVP